MRRTTIQKPTHTLECTPSNTYSFASSHGIRLALTQDNLAELHHPCIRYLYICVLLMHRAYICLWCERVAPPIIKETHSWGIHTHMYVVIVHAGERLYAPRASDGAVVVLRSPSYLICANGRLTTIPQNHNNNQYHRHNELARLYVAAKIKCVILNESRHV